MLKKMRWRFIGAAMAAFTAVVLTLLCFVNLWNYASVTRQQDATLDRLLEVDKENADVPAGKVTPLFENMGRYSPEVPYMIRFFSVHLSGDGTVERVNQDYIASISESDAERYAQAAPASAFPYCFMWFVKKSTYFRKISAHSLLVILLSLYHPGI